MATTLQRLTAVVRPVDIRTASNRLAIFATVVAVIIGTVIAITTDDAEMVPALGRGVIYGVGTFLAWALARELDPDHAATARFAVFAYAAGALQGPPALAANFAALMAIRIIARTTGRAPTTFDLVALIGLAIAAAFSPVGFIAALGLAYAFFADSTLPDATSSATARLVAGGTIVLAIGAAAASGAFPAWRLPAIGEAAFLAAVLVAASRQHLTPVDSVSDSGIPIASVRVARARIVAAAMVGIGIVYAGGAGIGALAPLLAALVGVGLTGTAPTDAQRHAAASAPGPSTA